MVSVDGFCSEAHFVLYAEFLLHGGYCFGELGFEELAVVCRNSEVETYLAAFRGRSLSAFGKLLFEGCAHAVRRSGGMRSALGSWP